MDAEPRRRGRGQQDPERVEARFLTILVTRDENDVALLRYVSDGNGGWLRDGYAARTSALRPS